MYWMQEVVKMWRRGSVWDKVAMTALVLIALIVSALVVSVIVVGATQP